MADYELKIGAFTPATIPMARLAEYMGAFADLLGDRDRVHFEKLDPGSTVLAVNIQPEARARTKQRIREARSADIDDTTYKPFKRLNQLLREDNADGVITAKGAQVIHFPGCREVLPAIVGPFNKHTDLDGVLVRIGGRDKTAHAQIEDAEGRTWNCEVNHDMARRLAQYLFGAPVRLSGEGRWLRNEQAEWELKRFKATTFKVLGERTLQASIGAIRRLELRLDDNAVAR